MQVETHQLTRRYEHLRKRHLQQERNLLTSLAEIGQQLPVIVVADAAGFVLIDGYKRLRALERLGHDTVEAIQWQVPEVDALLLERGLRQGSEDILDQAWLLAELRDRFGWSLEQIGRHFEHGKSWVSDRLGLIKILPQQIQEQVRRGHLSAYAAMKYLVPFSRENAQAAQQLAAAIMPIQPTSREVGLLYKGWTQGTEKTRELILTHPHIYLKAQEAQEPAPPSATEQFLQDLGALGGIARRAYSKLQDGLLQQLLESERMQVKNAFAQTSDELKRLLDRVELETIT